MLTEKDYCDYETCVALEEVGFPLHPYGNTEIDTSLRLTVLLYEAQKWLRDKRLMFVQIHKLLYGGYRFHVLDLTTYTEEGRGEADGYEDALLEGIKEAVKILKDK